MAKLDKSKYTKQQIKELLAERKRIKSVKQIQEQVKVTSPNEHTNKSYAFVLGNGTSRKDIDLHQLKEFGKIYGCNALYREFDPDYLICVDVKMILELDRKNHLTNHSNVWTNPNRAYRNLKNLNFFTPSKGWSSGPTALHLASTHKPKIIFILGFDYKGLNQGKSVNNMYADTPNYKRTTDPATYYGNWLKQTKNCISENKDIKYFRVITQENYVPEELNSFNNLEHILVEDFKKMFNIF